MGWCEVSEDESELVIFVTCSIREKAEQKVWSEIGRLNSRESGPPAIAVVGCMAQRTGTRLETLLFRLSCLRTEKSGETPGGAGKRNDHGAEDISS